MEICQVQDFVVRKKKRENLVSPVTGTLENVRDPNWSS